MFKQQELLNLPPKQRRKMAGEQIAMIMQSPMTAFDPLFTIANQGIETIRQHRAISKKEAKALLCDALKRVHLKSPETLIAKYPHELSGGMLQRIMIAFALVLEPKLIIADEPTTAIDYISQREVIKELHFIREQFGTSLIFVSHDLSLISHIADKVLVMNQGKCVDYGTTQAIFTDPSSAYTRYLIDSRMELVNRFRASLREKDAN